MEKWAKKGQRSEKRPQAKARIEAWLKKPVSERETLSLIALDLNKIPPLPDTVEKLRLNSNQLTSLIFPAGMSALKELFLNHNQLTSLTLPEGMNNLERIQLQGNRLTSLTLPEGMSALESLNLNVNRLTNLPNGTLHLPHTAHVLLENNSFSEQTLLDLGAAINAPGYSGPRIEFNMARMAQRSSSAPTRLLKQAVAGWYPTADKPSKAALWAGFQSEEGAKDFSKFIRRLGQDNINNTDQVFRAKVTAWLDELAEDPELRKKSFLAALGASASCEDRISLVFNDMNKIKLTHDVEKGLYDDKLPELIALARSMFRLDVLEKIAREKVSTLNFVDEIEVYLAYQVKLHEQLDLPIAAEKMRYFGVAHVTAEDLAIAERRVKAEEDAHFADYLTSEWGPWQAVAKRLDPEGATKAQDDLMESLETRFPEELEALAIKRGFSLKDPDVSRILGPEVSKRLATEFNGDLTRGILEKHGLTNALKPKWRSKGKGKA